MTGGATIRGSAPSAPPPPALPVPDALAEAAVATEAVAIEAVAIEAVAGEAVVEVVAVEILPAHAAAIPAAEPPAATVFTELPASSDATLKSGAVLTVPPGAAITVIPNQGAASQLLALPGTTDIALFAGQQLKIRPWAALAAGDVTVNGAVPEAPPPWAAPDPAPARPGYRLGEDHALTLPGGAKISVLGRASLRLPAGTTVAVPGAIPHYSPRRSSLKTTTTFPLPHAGQVIASQMWSLLAASFLTLFGTGAELGLLGVLTWSLASAELLVRAACLVLIVVSAFVVFFYSVTSIRALADPAPGDALNATSGTSFIL